MTACRHTPWGREPLADPRVKSEDDEADAQVRLSGPMSVFLAIVAAHDRVTPAEWVEKAVAARIDAIGLGTALDLLAEHGVGQGDLRKEDRHE